MIWEIAKREIVTRVRTRAFQILTAILLIGVLAGSIAAGVLTGSSDEPTEVTIGLSGDGVAFAEALSVATEDLEPTVVETDDGETLLADGEIDVLFTGDELVWDGFPSASTDLFIRFTVQQAEFGESVAELGLSDAELTTLFGQTPIEERLLDGEDDEQFIRIAAAGVSTFAMFFFLQIWGAFVMMGVVEEKSSRIVEVLLSHITPRTLLTGKILGFGVLAFGQLLIIIIGLTVGLLLVQDIEIPSGVWASVPVLVITFVLGFAFYAAAFAALGSTVSRQEDAQSAQLPALMPLIFAYIIATSSFTSPDSIVILIASFVPFTSPIVLPFRVALSDPPLWQVGLSLLILAASAPLMLNLAGKIYKTTLLRVGTRIPLKEAFSNRNLAD